MSDRFIEKSFLYLLLFSLVLHAGVFALFYYLPEVKPSQAKEPVFVDLQEVPELTPPQPGQQETKRYSEQRKRVQRETAPRGDAARDSSGPAPRQPAARSQSQAAESLAARNVPQAAPSARPSYPLPAAPQESPVASGSSASGLLKPRQKGDQQMSRSQLFPGAQRLAKLEEGYRRKFENEVAEGETRFLNSDDILFGSFLRRFETAVYGVWRYPQEAAQKGIEGITPVRITFNRRGEVANVQLLESSGARILDEEVMRTLRAIGPIGSFPKGYDKDEFHLIAFFQYGGARRALR